MEGCGSQSVVGGEGMKEEMGEDVLGNNFGVATYNAHNTDTRTNKPASTIANVANGGMLFPDTCAHYKSQ